MEGAAQRACRLRGPARTATPRTGTVSGASQPAIVAVGVRKSFDAKVVLDGVDLTVAEGTVFALLGPNGAGKTTMIRILSTLIAPDAGRVRVAGHDVVDDSGRGAGCDRGHWPVLGAGRAAHGSGEPAVDGRSEPSGPQRWAGAGGRVARPVRACRRGTQARVDLLRRYAPPARPGHDACRLPEGHLPRRTHHRAGPGEPPEHVGQHP